MNQYLALSGNLPLKKPSRYLLKSKDHKNLGYKEFDDFLRLAALHGVCFSEIHHNKKWISGQVEITCLPEIRYRISYLNKKQKTKDPLQHIINSSNYCLIPDC